MDDTLDSSFYIGKHTLSFIRFDSLYDRFLDSDFYLFLDTKFWYLVSSGIFIISLEIFVLLVYRTIK